MTSEEELREALEGKKLKELTLPQDSNDIDQGSSSLNAKEKIGQKSSLAWYEHLQERDKKMQYGDKQAIAEYIQEASEIRQRLEEQKYRERLEYDLIQEEKARLKKESRITPEDTKKEKEDIEKLERRKQKEINNIHDYFNCSDHEWGKWLSDGHEPEESPANVLIGTGTVGFVCDIHRYKQTIPMPDGRLATSAFTIGPIEDHIRKYEPEVHKEAIIQSINEKYEKIIEDRKELTLEDPDITLKKEIREINKIKTRPGGDITVTKITKGEKARIREAEEIKQAKNRRIYGGLYS